MFAGAWGVAEDPATGSAAAAFAGVVLAFDRPGDGEHALTIEQGFEMGRPSLIALGLDGRGRRAALRDDRRLGRHRLQRRARPLSEPARLLEVAELDLAFEPARWAFAERHAASIAAHWARLRKTKPALFNGRVLLLGRRAIESRPDGALKLRGAYFETDYADFLAWREFGYPGEPVDNCFSMAALRGADGAFLLGEMAPHTYNAGQIYFPAGTPDPTDIFDGKVDLDASARRELFEETGVEAERDHDRARLDRRLRAPAHRLHEAHDARRPRRADQGADRRLSRAATLMPNSRACISCAARATSTRRGCRSSSPRTFATRSLRDRSDSRDAFPRRRSSPWPRRRGPPRRRFAPRRSPA